MELIIESLKKKFLIVLGVISIIFMMIILVTPIVLILLRTNIFKGLVILVTLLLCDA
jgi:hypothetical protein